MRNTNATPWLTRIPMRSTTHRQKRYGLFGTMPIPIPNGDELPDHANAPSTIGPSKKMTKTGKS